MPLKGRNYNFKNKHKKQANIVGKKICSVIDKSNKITQERINNELHSFIYEC